MKKVIGFGDANLQYDAKLQKYTLKVKDETVDVPNCPFCGKDLSDPKQASPDN